MSLLQSEAALVSVERLSTADVDGKRQFVASHEISITVQPLENEEIALHNGSLTRSFKAYCAIGTDIKESDRITIAAGNRWNIVPGTYDLKAKQTFTFSSVSHIKLFLERPLHDA